MKKNWILSAVLAVFLISSCEKVEDLVDDPTLTEEEVIEGLKRALAIGVDTAVSELNILNGYYEGDRNFIFIPLPPEAENVRQLITNNNLASLFNLDDKFENVVKAVNRAAEVAASDAGPIFGDAITSLSISDGWDILHGVVPGDASKSDDFDSTAATTYLLNVTYDTLTHTFAPYINTALGQDLGLGFSAIQAWNTLTSAYNGVVSNPISQLTINATGVNMPNAIETDLGIFSTQKALDGLFFKVGEEEKKIRQNPFEWAVDIIRKVFGYIQDQLGS